METVKVTTNEAICTVSLNRPEVKNAFNEVLVRELTEAFQTINSDTQLRSVILKGEGDIFCAGADIKWMQKSINYTEEQNYNDALNAARMYRSINECKIPVICLVRGGAYGGGAGLVAVSDIVIAEEDAKFAFSEVKLGIIPSMIAPFALNKIGERYARRYFLTAELFTAETAKNIGLIHEVAKKDEIEGVASKLIYLINKNGPNAVKRAKNMIRSITHEIKYSDTTEYTSKTIAEIRTTDEAQEGLKAFIEKRRPSFDISKKSNR